MAAMPFKVKAIYAYSSEHDDDLKFPEAQIITVTEEEDDDWYVGEYVDSTGAPQSGLFPKNFVERYEPAPPPRPTRTARPKPAEAPALAPEPSSPQLPIASKPKAEEVYKPAANVAPPPAPSEERSAPVPSPKPASKPFPIASEPPPAPKPTQATPSKPPPPPVAEKSMSFKERMNLFNKGGATAPPIAPFKPGGSAPSTFIKKPFVAPPPSRNAFVPQAQQQPPPQTIYRREEDPEIAQRQADDEEAAQKAGLVPGGSAEGDDEDAPKPVSLKERIALLQKQQQEQAARRVDTTHKKKPERPPKKRTESHEAEDVPTRDSIDTDGERGVRGSSELPREQPVRRPSKGPKAPEVPPRETFSDGNEADQSAAGETTEDNDHDSSTEDETTVQRHEHAPAAQADVGDEEDLTEEGDEEEEVDEEVARQNALRERMMKISGGMGMPGMFGGAMPMPGMGGAPPKKKKPAPERSMAEDAEPTIASSAPRVPIPGMGARTLSQESEMTISRSEDDQHEDVRTAAPSVPKERASPTTERGPPPPVPGGRPSTEGRKAPLSPAAPIESPTAGSESDDELPQSSTGVGLPTRGLPPSVPQSPTEPRSPPPRPSIERQPTQPSSPTDRRASRVPPPLPVSSPTMAPSAQTRLPPPPPPPTQAPPTRQSTSDSLHRRALGATGEDGSEYEGDYDTDIAPGAKHKDALKSHGRESSFDDSIAPEDTSVRSPSLSGASFSPPMPNSAPRGVPPLPPTGPPRRSADIPRGAPPPVPSSAQHEDDEEYDPYKYSPGAPIPGSRPPPARQAPPAMPPMPPPVPAFQQEESDEDDEELYAPPTRKSTDQPRKSTDRPPPPLPPQAPPHHDRAPPPLPPQAPPPPAQFDQLQALPSGKAPVRPSTEQERSYAAPSRISSDQQLPPRMSASGYRPDIVDSGFIAREIDLAESSRWWSQPNVPPPSVQGRNDVLYEIEESTKSDRNGQTIISKDVYILYQDYSQTIVTAHFNTSNVDDVSLEQRQEPPPGKLRQDQLENSWNRFGKGISKLVEKMVGSAAISDGSSHALIIELLRGLQAALPPVGTRAYGALVYSNLGNASIQQFDEIRPGDVVSFRNAKFAGKHGGLHGKYSLDVAVHVGIATEWDGTKKKIRVAEQGRDSHGEAVEGGKGSKPDKKKKKGKIEVESYRLDDLKSGEVRVWRVVSRGFVSWDDQHA